MNTYKISRVGHNLDKDHSLYKPPFDFEFSWKNEEEETFIIVSLHGAVKLAETFQKFGYKQKKDSIKFVEGLSY